MAHNERSEHVTTTTHTGGAGMGVLIGLLIAAVAILAFFVFGGTDLVGGSSDGGDVTISIEGAGEAVEGAAAAIEEGAESVGTAVQE
ncbi:MAG: hypothetical protein AAGL23_18480 [Pseudomonadota bacterium]